jgi:DNA-binding NarL/FixJ family response regulator
MIAVAVVEDHEVFRQGLAQSLAAAPGIEVLFAVASVEDADAVRARRPDVVLMDMHLQGCDDRSLSSLCDEGLAVLAMSAAATIPEVIAALSAGARGYLAKDSSTEETIRALGIVARGHTYVSPTLASFLLRDRTIFGEGEQRVLDLVAQGEREADIAAELGGSSAEVHEQLDRACRRVRTASRR